MPRFARFAWGLLAYDVAVVAWGAYVRATGSGAGCGAHWPLCNGELVPRSPPVEMLIELSHRITSGLAIALSLVLLVWSLRAYPRGHVVRSAALAWPPMPCITPRTIDSPSPVPGIRLAAAPR